MVRLFKQVKKYIDKDGKERRAINFLLSNEEGNRKIPIDVKYFPKEEFNGRDPEYQGRKGFLEGIAETLPEKDDKGE